MAVRYGLEQDASGVPYLVAEGAVGEDEILLDSPTAVKHFLNSDYIRLGHQAEEHVWMLSGLKEGEGCRLTLTKGSNESVWEVDVYYAKTSDLQKNAVSAAISGNAENTGNTGSFKASFVPAFACDLEMIYAPDRLHSQPF